MKNFLSNLKANWKALIVPILFIAVALIAKTVVLSGNNYPVAFYKQIDRPGYEPAPAFYKVSVSPAKAWDMTHSTTTGKVCSIVGSVFFILAILVLIAAALDIFILPASDYLICALFFLVIWSGFKYGAHSSAVSNTSVQISPEKYEEVKDSKEKLEALFDNKKPL